MEFSCWSVESNFGKVIQKLQVLYCKCIQTSQHGLGGTYWMAVNTVATLHSRPAPEIWSLNAGTRKIIRCGQRVFLTSYISPAKPAEGETPVDFLQESKLRSKTVRSPYESSCSVCKFRNQEIVSLVVVPCSCLVSLHWGLCFSPLLVGGAWKEANR